MEHVVSIAPHGATKSMHSDEFSLEFLGEQNIERVSEILWNKQTQTWDIHFVDDAVDGPPAPEYSGFRRYDEARAFEVQIMNFCLENSVGPYDYEIRLVAAGLRK